MHIYVTVCIVRITSFWLHTTLGVVSRIGYRSNVKDRRREDSAGATPREDSAGATPKEEGSALTARTSRPLVSPDMYSGVQSWSDWVEHFESTAGVNGWSEATKLLWLPVRLTGKVQTAWKRLTPDAKSSYAAAKEALQKRFKPERKRKLYLVEFQTRRR